MIYAAPRLMSRRRDCHVEIPYFAFLALSGLHFLRQRDTFIGGFMKRLLSRRISLSVFAILALTVITLLVVACGSSSTPGTSGGSSMATVNIRISDPATCQSPNGPFSHVF